MKPTYIRFLTGLKAYSRIFSVRTLLIMGDVFNYSLTSWQHQFFCICNSPSMISPAETCFWCSKKQVCYWGLVVCTASFQLKRLGTILFIMRHLFFSEDRMYYRCHLMRTQWCTLLYSSSNLITLLKLLLIIYHPCALWLQNLNHTWTRVVLCLF